MKLRLTVILFIATAVFAPLNSRASTLAITESGESLSATLDGGPFSDITFTPAPAVRIGGQEEWIITLTGGYTWAPSAFVPGQPFILEEPAGEFPGNDRVNLIGIPLLGPVGPLEHVTLIDDVGGPDDLLILPPNSIIWASDVPFFDVVPDALFANPIPGGVLNANGEPLDLLLADVAAAPDAGSTLALAALGLVALSSLRSRLSN